MTDNTTFKENTEKLFSALREYKKNYSFMSSTGRGPKDSPIDLLDAQLRTHLEVLRTDEENQNQRKRDSYC